MFSCKWHRQQYPIEKQIQGRRKNLKYNTQQENLLPTHLTVVVLFMEYFL